MLLTLLHQIEIAVRSQYCSSHSLHFCCRLSSIPASSVLLAQSPLDGKIHHISVQLLDALNENDDADLVTYEHYGRGEGVAEMSTVWVV